MALIEKPEAERAAVLADKPPAGDLGAPPSALSTQYAALVLGLIAAALLVAPFVVPAYYLTKMLPFFAYGVTLLGLNLLFGYTGLLSFGHALFLGLGAYTVAVATTGLGIRSIDRKSVV